MKNAKCLIALTCLLAGLSAAQPGCDDREANPPPVAATNTLLECAVRDLLGPEARVLRLAGPGMCPGHFDIRPSQVGDLSRCRLMLRLDFQKALDRKLTSATDRGLHIREIQPGGGLCRPESYLAVCRQVADALVETDLLHRPNAEQRLAEIGKRIQAAGADCRQRIRQLEGTPVLTSMHQADFCRWLGLDPVDEFASADVGSVTQLDRAVRAGQGAGVGLIVANRPEGRRAADALADRLNASVVVFDNFPRLGDGHESFDDLLADNVRRLLEAR